jgi:hypothetical protein
MPAIDLSILNQRQTPAFYADTLANRPAAGFVGRIFVSTDTFAFYRDNGTTWDLIGGPGTGTITGSGANGQVSYWNGASTITGSNDLFFDNVNGHLGIGTVTPGTALDVKHDQSTVVQLEQITATNDIRIAFINSGVGLWRLGAFYNAGANDFGLFDIAAAAQPVTVKRTTGQVLIGTSTVGSGKLVVASATSDNGIQIVGATAPSLRIDSAETAPTKRAGLGISTGVNNFIQGSADRDFCIFNGSTTAASPILFGVYDAGATNVQEAARISAARNFLIGTTTDAGQKLQVKGSALIDGNVLLLTGVGLTEFKINNGTTEWEMYMPSGSTDLRLYRGTDKVTFTSAGNLGLGVAPSTGGLSGYNLFEMGSGTGGMSIYSGTNQTLLGTNISWSAGSATYKVSNFAEMYNQQSGLHQWYTSGTTGTAGNPITFIEVMRTTNSANLLIGTTTDAGQKLQVNGTSYLNGDVNLSSYGSGPTISVPSGTASVINTNGGTIFNYFSVVPSPYTQDIQIDITFVNWGANPVVALVDLMTTLREFGGTSGVAYGKIFANSPAVSTFTSFDTTNITTSQCSVSASSGGNYILRITINPSSVTDRYGIYLNIQYGGIGAPITNIAISYV